MLFSTITIDTNTTTNLLFNQLEPRIWKSAPHGGGREGNQLEEERRRRKKKREVEGLDIGQESVLKKKREEKRRKGKTRKEKIEEGGREGERGTIKIVLIRSALINIPKSIGFIALQ